MSAETLRLRRLRARYHMPRADGDARERLDAVLGSVLDHGLEAELRRAGLPNGEICVRAVDAPVRLGLAAADAALASAWSAALANAIRAAITHGAPEVIRYPSRRSALLDLAVSVADGRFEHAWAWRSLGLWARDEQGCSEGEAAEQLIRALVAEPEAIVPVLAHLAERGRLGSLAERFAPAAFDELAHAALAAAGASEPSNAAAATVSRPRSRGGVSDHVRSPAAAVRAQLELAGRVVCASAIARALSEDVRMSMAAPRVRRALALLAVLEASPPTLGRGRVELPYAVATLLAEKHTDDRRAGPRTGGSEAEATATLEVTPDVEPRVAANDVTTADVEPIRTAEGGLLFLLHIVGELDLADSFAAAAPLAARTVRWSMHALAGALRSLSDDDPAALAFAGLPPDARPPSRDDDPAEPGELEAIAAAAAAVVTCLRERLERPEQPTDEVLDFVCKREAEVVAEPGWIELRFAQDEVSLDVRRAGLDLDPGYVPWLGTVVRFAYV
jgi:hypothetical protein